MVDESNDNNIYIDLIEPKFDPTHEVSRAMVEYNEFISSYHKLLTDKFDEIKDIGTAVFNRRVWGCECDQEKGLLGDDHFLFSNISSKFELKKGDKELFKSILHSLKVKKGGDCPDTESPLLGHVHVNDWEHFINRLNSEYKESVGYQMIDEKQFILRSDNNAETVCKYLEDNIDKGECKGALTELLKDFTSLLRMPVLGGIPGALFDHLVENLEECGPRPYLFYLPYLKSKDKKKQNKIIAYCLSKDEELSEHKLDQPPIFNDRVDIDPGNINLILGYLTQLLVEGIKVDLSYTVFFAIPVYEYYFPADKDTEGDVLGYMQGWVFIPINLNEEENIREKFIRSLKDNTSALSELVEKCLIFCNILSSNVKDTGIRRVIEGASINEKSIVGAIKGSLHHMSGFKLENPLEKTSQASHENIGPFKWDKKNKELLILLGKVVGKNYETCGKSGDDLVKLIIGGKSFTMPSLGRNYLDLSIKRKKEISIREKAYFNNVVYQLRVIDSMVQEKRIAAEIEGKLKYQSGKIGAMHSVPDALCTVMGRLIAHQEEGKCDFKVPAELFLMSVDAAVRAKNIGDRKAFYKYVPRIDSINTELMRNGLTPELIDMIVENMARPLAESRIKNDRDPIVRPKKPSIVVNGVVAYKELGFGSVESSVCIALLVHLLKESIEHTEKFLHLSSIHSMTHTMIQVDLCETSIKICNPTAGNKTNKDVGYSESKDVNRVLSEYLKEKSGWELINRDDNEKYWCREISKN